jgi:hypothetical protein
MIAYASKNNDDVLSEDIGREESLCILTGDIFLFDVPD